MFFTLVHDKEMTYEDMPSRRECKGLFEVVERGTFKSFLHFLNKTNLKILPVLFERACSWAEMELLIIVGAV